RGPRAQQAVAHRQRHAMPNDLQEAEVAAGGVHLGGHSPLPAVSTGVKGARSIMGIGLGGGEFMLITVGRRQVVITPSPAYMIIRGEGVVIGTAGGLDRDDPAPRANRRAPHRQALPADIRSLASGTDRPDALSATTPAYNLAIPACQSLISSRRAAG